MASKTNGSKASGGDHKDEATGKAVRLLGDNSVGWLDHNPAVTGVTVKISPAGVTLVLKASVSSEGPMVAFVQSAYMEVAFRKAHGLGLQGKLEWKQDKWAGPKFDKDDNDW